MYKGNPPVPHNRISGKRRKEVYLLKPLRVKIKEYIYIISERWYDKLWKNAAKWRCCFVMAGARVGALGWGTSLQTGRSRVRFPMVLLEFFILHNPSGRTVVLGLTQPLTETSIRNISWRVKAAGAWGWQPYHLRVPIVFESGSLNLLEPSGPVKGCNGIALTFTFVVASKGSDCNKEACLVF